MATFPQPGLPALDPAETAILSLLDDQFQRIGATLGAVPVTGPALLPQDDLTKLDYFRNFPHLALAAAGFSVEGVRDLADGKPVDAASADLRPTGNYLPSATCYGLFLTLRGVALTDPQRLTAVGLCFRNESHYEGLRRLRGFRMREVLYVGSQEGATAHLDAAVDLVHSLTAAIGVKITLEAASDPFYLGDGARPLLARLDPVKHEFLISDGTAIGSVNKHRNFFGERLDIRFDGNAAYSSCLAFGLERWAHALVREHGTAEHALAALRAARE